MPINACSINTYSVDAICSTKRTKYIDWLWQTVPPTIASGGGGGWPGYMTQFNSSGEQKINAASVELPYISITVMFDGQVSTSVFDNQPFGVTPMITINNLVSEKSEISLNVTEPSIGPK